MKFPVGSYTFYNDAINCPYKGFRKYVAKDLPREDPTPELKWGREVHEAMEHRLTRDTPLPESMKAAEPLCAMLTAPEPVARRVEYFTGIKIDGSPCRWDADGIWFRGKCDVVLYDISQGSAWLVDWKTGKPREEPFELECQAMLIHANHPEVVSIVGEYYWMKEGRAGMRYTLDPVRAFQTVATLYGEMKGYFDKGHWPKRKNPLCGWCPVKDCEHNTSEKRR